MEGESWRMKGMKAGVGGHGFQVDLTGKGFISCFFQILAFISCVDSKSAFSRDLAAPSAARDKNLGTPPFSFPSFVLLFLSLFLYLYSSHIKDTSCEAEPRAFGVNAQKSFYIQTCWIRFVTGSNFCEAVLFRCLRLRGETGADVQQGAYFDCLTL